MLVKSLLHCLHNNDKKSFAVETKRNYERYTSRNALYVLEFAAILLTLILQIAITFIFIS